MPTTIIFGMRYSSALFFFLDFSDKLLYLKLVEQTFIIRLATNFKLLLHFSEDSHNSLIKYLGL